MRRRTAESSGFSIWSSPPPASSSSASSDTRCDWRRRPSWQPLVSRCGLRPPRRSPSQRRSRQWRRPSRQLGSPRSTGTAATWRSAHTRCGPNANMAFSQGRGRRASTASLWESSQPPRGSGASRATWTLPSGQGCSPGRRLGASGRPSATRSAASRRRRRLQPRRRPRRPPSRHGRSSGSRGGSSPGGARALLGAPAAGRACSATGSSPWKTVHGPRLPCAWSLPAPPGRGAPPA